MVRVRQACNAVVVLRADEIHVESGICELRVERPPVAAGRTDPISDGIPQGQDPDGRHLGLNGESNEAAGESESQRSY